MAMICIGSIADLKSELEEMVLSNYPDRLDDPTLISVSCRYEAAMKALRQS